MLVSAALVLDFSRMDSLIVPGGVRPEPRDVREIPRVVRRWEERGKGIGHGIPFQVLTEAIATPFMVFIDAAATLFSVFIFAGPDGVV